MRLWQNSKRVICMETCYTHVCELIHSSQMLKSDVYVYGMCD